MTDKNESVVFRDSKHPSRFAHFADTQAGRDFVRRLFLESPFASLLVEREYPKLTVERRTAKNLIHYLNYDYCAVIVEVDYYLVKESRKEGIWQLQYDSGIGLWDWAAEKYQSYKFYELQSLF